MKKSQLNNLFAIKNVTILNNNFIELINNQKTLKLVQFLYKEGFIQTYSCSKTKIFLFLRYYDNKSFFNEIKLMSKPSQKKFLSYKTICNFSKSNKTLFFSTDIGLCNQFDCMKNLKGGKLLFII
jgi:ribosomal protein S8